MERRAAAKADGVSEADLVKRDEIARIADAAFDDAKNKLNIILDGMGDLSIVTLVGKALGLGAGLSAGAAWVGSGSAAAAAAALGIPAAVVVAPVVAGGTAVLLLAMPSFANAGQARTFLVEARDSIDRRVGRRTAALRSFVKDAVYDGSRSTAQVAAAVDEFLREYAKDLDERIRAGREASSIFTNAFRKFRDAIRKVLGAVLPESSDIPGWVWALGGLVALGFVAQIAGSVRSARE